MQSLALRHRITLELQRAIGRCTILLYGPLALVYLYWVKGYRVHDLARLRRSVRNILAANDGPILICPNHLTMADSAIIQPALVPIWHSIVRYRLLPWNAPERTIFSSFFLRQFLYLAKCIPITRGGSRQDQQLVLAKFHYVLRRGDLVVVFPEGRRSRTGKVDREAIADGVGRLIKMVPNCQVLCVYMRGDGQEQYSSWPKRGEWFRIDLKLVCPRAHSPGIRGTREIATEIIGHLADMEEAYFARRE